MKIATILFIIFIVLYLFLSNIDTGILSEANSFLKNEQYEEAIEKYKEARSECENDKDTLSTLCYNQGIAQYKKGNFVSSEKCFQDANTQQQNRAWQVQTQKNLGDAVFRQAQQEKDEMKSIETLEKSVFHYKDAHNLDSDDPVIKNNLRNAQLLLRYKKDQLKNKQQSSSDSQDKEKNDNSKSNDDKEDKQDNDKQQQSNDNQNQDQNDCNGNCSNQNQQEQQDKDNQQQQQQDNKQQQEQEQNNDKQQQQQQNNKQQEQQDKDNQQQEQQDKDNQQQEQEQNNDKQQQEQQDNKQQQEQQNKDKQQQEQEQNDKQQQQQHNNKQQEEKQQEEEQQQQQNQNMQEEIDLNNMKEAYNILQEEIDHKQGVKMNRRMKRSSVDKNW